MHAVVARRLHRELLSRASIPLRPQPCCSMKRYDFPVTFENVIFPPNGELKLRVPPAKPVYDVDCGEKEYKSTKRMIEARGVEEVHTELIHKQFGLMAITGGFISASDCEWIADRVNKNLRARQFAIWRIEDPWLPRTKKPQGTKLGGGKGRINKYVTPVRANRIILELAGHITELEARAYLLYICERFPFPVEFVSEEILTARRATLEQITTCNTNPFNWDNVIKYNMQNSCSWLSPYDIMWRGRYK